MSPGLRPCLVLLTFIAAMAAEASPAPANLPKSLTPPEVATPRINGPSRIGVRPGSPVLYTIPATGDRPVAFSAEGLPAGLILDPATGRISGTLAAAGEHAVVLHARNAQGEASRTVRFVAGDRIALTPPLGWSSWNCFGKGIDQDKILRQAKALVAQGLDRHGFTYINMDDGWQGKRTGQDKALQGNEQFPDMGGLVREIHSLGLKAGIYSTPWTTSYAGFPGGSSDAADGSWTKSKKSFGSTSFAKADAAQWAAWGFDFIKYDWNPVLVPQVAEMSTALRTSGRDIVFSLSNSGLPDLAPEYAKLSELWRTTGDIVDEWADAKPDWGHSVSEIGFSQDAWAVHAGPGHWNDPDMMVVGQMGLLEKQRASHLTADELYTHVSLWAIMAAPLILGCDLEHLDAFTRGLITNDEVLAIDQDELGRQGVRIATNGAIDIYAKPLADGATALGFFNRGDTERSHALTRLKELRLGDRLTARDVWRQQDLPVLDKKTVLTIPAHGVLLLRVKAVQP